MKIFLLLALFISTSIFALNIKVKIKQYNNITYVKSMYIYNEKLSILTKLHDRNYISYIKIKADDKLVFDMKLSKIISIRPIIKFKYKNINASYLHVEVKQVNSKLIKLDKKIKKVDRDRALVQKYPKLNKNAKRYTLNSKELIESGVKIIAPDVASWGGSIPVTVLSSIEAKSVKLFVQVENEYLNKKDAKEKNMYLACEWIQTPYSIVDYHVRIGMEYSGYIRVVIESKDGKFYTAQKFIVTAVAGTNV